MLILDTNVVSELMNPQGLEAVKTWAKQQVRQDVFVTAITQAEILYGIRTLPEGRRKSRLQASALAVFEAELAN